MQGLDEKLNKIILFISILGIARIIDTLIFHKSLSLGGIFLILSAFFIRKGSLNWFYFAVILTIPINLGNESLLVQLGRFLCFIFLIFNFKVVRLLKLNMHKSF